MPFATALTKRLRLTHPIIQAPMAGGGDTPELVAAVCEAGAIGFIGAAYLTPGADRRGGGRHPRQDQAAVRDQPVRAGPAAPVPGDPAPAIARVAAYYAEMGLPPPAAPAPDDEHVRAPGRRRPRQRCLGVQLHVRPAAAARGRRRQVARHGAGRHRDDGGGSASPWKAWAPTPWSCRAARPAATAAPSPHRSSSA